MNQFPSQILALRHSAWMPVVEANAGLPTASKFGGIPWLQPGESWPTCQHCGQPMPLFLQLNLAELPEALRGKFGEGLLQLFYCTNTDAFCETECDTFFPFTEGKFVRLIVPESETPPVVPEQIAHFPEQRIIGWKEADDYPDSQEALEQGVEYAEREWEALIDADFPRSGDKLSGWPHWIQGIEYPNCRICQTPMRLVFQLDSNDHLPFMFGDMGCGHVTQCLEHKSEVTFAWACS
ncbi:hypothetical protein U14_04793 [Candidatus Moduliflexus flocculans]|uniref:DUF1963 domain-containing protein n=1 Tax=Candidatus Moduliflexus flocculans TaxID=1499966 RepID=A0A0S6W159_9BACT|nr:hypothetical protein U14_04793 [Candidatus Moduliflexus flocculans]